MPRDNFNFQYIQCHFTWKTHIPFPRIKELFESIQPVEWYSIVHESSDTENSYDHTHAAVRWKAKPHKRNARFADIDDIHPHIQPITTKDHARRIYYEYHRKSPVLLEQSPTGPSQPSTLESIQSAATLYDACAMLKIIPKTVADVMLLRKDRAKPPAQPQNFRDTMWTMPLLHDFTCMFVSGPTKYGKTQWALHCFNSPLVVSHMDQLRDFNPNEHDGIVFDDMSFAHHPRETVIHLTDWDMDRAIHARYNAAVIPHNTRKIFTSNLPFDQVFPEDHTGAIRRRFSHKITVTRPLFPVGENGEPLPQIGSPRAAPESPDQPARRRRINDAEGANSPAANIDNHVQIPILPRRDSLDALVENINVEQRNDDGDELEIDDDLLDNFILDM